MRLSKVDEQTLYQAPAGWLKSAVDILRTAGIEVMAPTEIESGVVDFTTVNSSDVIVTSYGNVRLGLKRLFFPITEVLLEFEKQEDGDVQITPRPVVSPSEVVVMGSRPCDVAALEAIDKVFQWDYEDVRYMARRKRTTLVSFACSKPDTECFCTSVGGSPHGSLQSDVLVFHGDDGKALMKVYTAKGKKFIERLGDVVQPAPAGTILPTPPDIQSKFDPEKVKSWLDENFESDFWTEISLKCLGCGTCTFLCPTCHCFDIVDEANWKCGQRRQNWDYCSHPMFTKHASGHNPRTLQAARYRQRLMHKFKYFSERFGQIACVGCGRCIKACSVGQNIINNLTYIESKWKGGSGSDGR